MRPPDFRRQKRMSTWDTILTFAIAMFREMIVMEHHKYGTIIREAGIKPADPDGSRVLAVRDRGVLGWHVCSFSSTFLSATQYCQNDLDSYKGHRRFNLLPDQPAGGSAAAEWIVRGPCIP